jgi:hypothetical protein
MFITKKFIEKVHDAFDELNYHETKQLDFESFEKAATKTLTHAKELSDAIDVVLMYQFCLKKWNKIEKIFNKKLHIFNNYSYEGNSLVETVSDEDSLGTYYITNGINNKVKDIVIASNSFEEEIFSLGLKNGRFTIFEDGEYYIKYSKMSSVKMKLFDNKNDCLANIVLSENLGVFLENNKTEYELIVYDDFIGIYDRKYIESLSDTDLIDTEKLLADIEWDILEKKSKLGVAKLNIYNSDADLEMLLLFATSTFLVFQKYLQAEKIKTMR